MLAAIAASDEPDRVRAARRVHELPQPGAPRQAGRDDRRDQRRPAHPRARCRLERDGVPRVRLPVRPPRRPLRGGVHDHPHAPPGRRHRLRRALLPGARLRAAAARPTAERPAADDRLERAADAAHRGPARPGLEHLVRRHRQRPGWRRAAARRRRRGLSRRRARPGGDRADGRRAGALARRHRSDPGRLRQARRRPRSRARPSEMARRPAGATRARASATSSWSSIRSRAARSRPSHRCSAADSRPDRAVSSRYFRRVDGAVRAHQQSRQPWRYHPSPAHRPRGPDARIVIPRRPSASRAGAVFVVAACSA